MMIEMSLDEGFSGAKLAGSGVVGLSEGEKKPLSCNLRVSNSLLRRKFTFSCGPLFS
jgi:hypothetical protein